ncbi:hypothetical protein V5O48_004604 [Marasmius crinis-equi]|uniref:Uncharacterized protein n=1 Tax=Marasmius crinis-equi TaxID=585013 RepID=A0ABR3FPK9_9AGAR
MSYPYVTSGDYMAYVSPSESIVRGDHGSVCTLIDRVAGYLTTLVLNTTYCFPEVVEFMRRQSFPRVTDAQLPGPFIFHPPSIGFDNPNTNIIPRGLALSHDKTLRERWPGLQRVQLLYSNDSGIGSGFHDLDFSSFPSIVQASVSFHGFYGVDVQLTVSLIRMGSKLRTLIVEDNRGGRVPVVDVSNALVDRRLFFVSTDPFAALYPWNYRPRCASDYWEHGLRLTDADGHNKGIALA